MSNRLKNFSPRFVVLIVIASFFSIASVVLADGSSKVWKGNSKQGEKAIQAKNYPAAEGYFKLALAEAQKFGPKDDRLAKTLEDLGHLYLRTENFAAAEQLFEQDCQIRFGDPNPYLEATALNGHIAASECLKHYEPALKSLFRLQEIASKKLGADHPAVVMCLFREGKIYYELRDYLSAIPLLERSATLLAHPASHITTVPMSVGTLTYQTFYQTRYRPAYVESLEADYLLERIFINQNKFPQAEGKLQDQLKLVDEHWSAGDPALFEIVNNMANFYISVTNYHSAEPVLERLIKMEDKKFGPKDSTSLETRATLANVYLLEKKSNAAEALYQSILVDADKNFGATSRQSTVALENLAKFETDQGRYEQAEPLYRRELAQTEKVQPDGIALMPILSGQAIVYAKLNRDAELIEVYKREITVYEKMFGSASAALTTPVTECAKLLRKNKRDVEADAMKQKLKSLPAK